MVKLNLLANKPKQASPEEDSEQAAAYFLYYHHGLKFIQRNFSCKVGEIDLIMHDGSHWVFVEVRVRTNPHFADGAASVTSSKQKKLKKAALYYLQQHKLLDKVAIRFDVVSISKKNNQWHFDWIQHAFT